MFRTVNTAACVTSNGNIVDTCNGVKPSSLAVCAKSGGHGGSWLTGALAMAGSWSMGEDVPPIRNMFMHNIR
jgi:hypothetical protein